MEMDRSKSLPAGSYASLYGENRCTPKSYSFNGPSQTEEEFGCNPEAQRRKRVAGYNMYATKGKLKSSLRNSFKWIKSKFLDTHYHDHL